MLGQLFKLPTGVSMDSTLTWVRSAFAAGLCAGCGLRAGGGGSLCGAGCSGCRAGGVSAARTRLPLPQRGSSPAAVKLMAG